MPMLESKYKVKPSSIGDTKIHIGANVGTVLYVDFSYTWNMSSNLYFNQIDTIIRDFYVR